jgi:hypothetical protein
MFGITESLLMFVSALVLLGLVAGVPLAVWAIVKGTKQKSGVGINLSPPTACPQCGTSLPQVRVPKNIRQAMWGGWTCESCGIELDKWGRHLSES